MTHLLPFIWETERVGPLLTLATIMITFYFTSTQWWGSWAFPFRQQHPIDSVRGWRFAQLCISLSQHFRSWSTPLSSQEFKVLSKLMNFIWPIKHSTFHSIYLQGWWRDADLLKVTVHVSPCGRKLLPKASTSALCLGPSHSLLPCPVKGHNCLSITFSLWLGATLWDYYAFCIYLFHIKILAISCNG